MTPCALQVPPRGVLESSTIVCTGPPAAATRFMRLRVKNSSDRLSGDQNGNAAPSVPASARAVKLLIGRSHNTAFPLVSAAMKASVVPSGEIVPLLFPSGAPSGNAHL